MAAQAGVSRVTVYAHFPAWTALLEAAVERAVRQTMTALQSVRPEDGPPVEALDRMLAATWQHLARYRPMAAAVAELLSPEAVTRTHQAVHHTIGALLQRGQADGSFRTDLPARWLLTASIALVHACSNEVQGRPHRRAQRGPHPHHLGPRPAHRNATQNGIRPCTTLNPPISHDPAGQATAQQPDPDGRARRARRQ